MAAVGRRWRPRSLRAQMVVLVLAGLALAQLLAFVIHRSRAQSELQALRDEFVLTRIVSVAQLLADTPASLHERIVRASSSPPLRFTLAGRSLLAEPEPATLAPSQSARGERLREALAALSGYPSDAVRVVLHGEARRRPPRRYDDRRDRRGDDRRGDDRRGDDRRGGFDRADDDDEGRDHDRRRPRFDGRPRPRGGSPAVLGVAIRLAPGRWLNASSELRPAEPFWQWSTLSTIGLSALILSLLIVLAVRRITRPLADLAGAAERFGRGEQDRPLVERGPADVRETIRAFNRMRTRLQRFVDDRTRMLAAISHDLRTPIAAMRLRAEMIEADDTRERILASLDEMQQITEATLSFVREDADREPTRRVDLAALLESVCDDFADTGADVDCRTLGKTTYRCRSLALTRALRNLIGNAIRYGGRARVRLQRSSGDGGVTIAIEDDGPGIAVADRERVFEPFVRLEASRNPETGGAGLGLAIARSVVRRHGGDIVLEDAAGGGLRVVVRLPPTPGAAGVGPGGRRN